LGGIGAAPVSTFLSDLRASRKKQKFSVGMCAIFMERILEHPQLSTTGRLDTGQDADDGSGSDEENTIVLVSAHHQIGVVVEIHIQAATQRIAKRRRRNARNILRFQNLFLFTSKLKLSKKRRKIGREEKNKTLV
jgi:hypothetical protein